MSRVTQSQMSQQIDDMREIMEVKLDNLSSEMGRISDIVLENRSEIDLIKLSHAEERGRQDERERQRAERNRRINMIYGTLGALLTILTIVSILLP